MSGFEPAKLDSESNALTNGLVVDNVTLMFNSANSWAMGKSNLFDWKVQNSTELFT